MTAPGSDISTTRQAGFTLLELLIALTLAATVLTVLIMLTLSVQRSVLVQQALAGLQTQARFAEQQLADRAASAGFHPAPWTGTALAPADGSLPAGAGRAHAELVLRELSQANCLGNRNPVLDGSGEPRFYLRISRWRIAAGQRLVETCHYGPPGAVGVRQLNASVRVEGVEALRIRFAEDTDDDGRADRWVRAGAWSDPQRLKGLRFALLLVSPSAVGAEPEGAFELLGETLPGVNDGRLRWLLERTVPFARAGS